MDNKQNKNPSSTTQGKSFSEKADVVKMLLFVVIMVSFMIIGLAFFARPSYSENEKRSLTKFPEFTLSGFLSGEFTNQVALWYSDTYPLRESMISASNSLEELYGLRQEQIVSGGDKDDIPDGPMSPISPDTDFKPVDDGQGETVNGLYLNQDTAYQLYSFNENNSKYYISLINKFAQSVDKSANVYDMIVPLHFQVALGKDTIDKLGTSNCESAINYMYSGLSDNVTHINTVDNLYAHNDEYLYYRTDHHWTARGAYYAFEAFCKSKGIEATPLSSYERLEFDGFLGTLYAEANQPSAMKQNPDTVEAFVPIGTNKITVTERNGNITVYQIVNKQTDTWYSAAGSKYNCFIAGDNPISEIHNTQISDGSSIVLVKDSFGNAFVPFLVDSYEYVYVIDYRYWSGSLADFVIDNQINDVLFLNVVNVTSTSSRLSELADIIE